MQILDIIKDAKLNVTDGEYKGYPLSFKYSCGLHTMIYHLSKYSEPCNVWGLVSNIKDDYYKILCLDINTGEPFDIEIWKHNFRLYNRMASPNTIHRLYQNLNKVTNIELIDPKSF